MKGRIFETSQIISQFRKSKVAAAFEIMVSFCTIVGLFLTVYLAFSYKDVENSKELVEVFTTVFWGLISVFISSLFLTISFAVKNGRLKDERIRYLGLEQELEKAKKIQDQVAYMQHNIFHATRDINCLMSNIGLNLTNKESNLEILNNQFKIYTNLLMSNIKDIFDVITDDVTSVSIKFFSPENGIDKPKMGDVLVSTYGRDNVSKRNRQSTDRKMNDYIAMGNSAFRHIFDEDQPYYYVCNDLKSNDKYVNLNDNWREYYNACIVSALVLDQGMNNQKSPIIGAICVDNFLGNFNSKSARDILASVSDVFSMSYVQYNLLRDKLK